MPSTRPQNRDGSGRFVKGVSGNPGGKPKVKPITEELKRQLEAVERGSKETNLVRVVRALIETARIPGTSEAVAASKLILAYVEGPPPQTIELDVKTEAERIAAEHGVDASKVISIYERLRKTG